mmetsp:Transcript_29383/g.94781  ORF Transcript_29383/g.94781 Transcript_29383/m.94781 type:complete len:292 (+) Transcript_29383:65-940(+)
MNNVRSIRALNERELELGIKEAGSWHGKYRDSAWVYVGGLPRELSEGDVVCVLSQFGEVEDFNMPRDAKTGRPRGWCWCKYEDQRSTVLAVDNFTGASLLGRTLRVDHCEKYSLPKELKDRPDKFDAGAIYKDADLASKHTLGQGQDLFDDEKDDDEQKAKKKKKKSHREEKKRRRSDDDDEKKKQEKKKTKKKKKKSKADDEKEEVLPLRAEDEKILREGVIAPLPLVDDFTKREGEILAPSWRGSLEPGAPQPHSSSRRRREDELEKQSTKDERDRTRHRSYGGMLRER